MIHDSFQNWDLYFRGLLAERIKAEIELALQSTKTFYKIIEPKNLTIRTMSYDLLPEASPYLILESHGHWIDIQFSIIQCERIDIFDRSDLTIKAYNPITDTYHYSTSTSPSISIKNIPGRFSMLFPDDIHRPMMSCGDLQHLYKGVVKLSLDFYDEMRKQSSQLH